MADEPVTVVDDLTTMIAFVFADADGSVTTTAPARIEVHADAVPDIDMVAIVSIGENTDHADPVPTDSVPVSVARYVDPFGTPEADGLDASVPDVSAGAY